jgi:glutathione S-transferase
MLLLRHLNRSRCVKLHWSPKSPFVRKVMIAAHECGVAERLELVRTVAIMSRPNAALMADNPLNKIPTLLLDDGTALYDSTVICEYFDALGAQASGSPRLFPQGTERWNALRRNALGSGVLDVLILWRNERERSAPSESLLSAFTAKVSAGLLAMQRDLESAPVARFDIGDIAMGCALAYLDFRFASFDWRTSHRLLEVWYSRFAQRPSVQATPIVDDRPTA